MEDVVHKYIPTADVTKHYAMLTAKLHTMFRMTLCRDPGFFPKAGAICVGRG
jgi:hypothetical protein